MFDWDYFRRLFPIQLQQKPGTDYYGNLMTCQFILMIYLVYSYANFGAKGPYEETNIFAAEMVIVLFFQIAILLLERYVARTSTIRVAKREKQLN